MTPVLMPCAAAALAAACIVLGIARWRPGVVAAGCELPPALRWALPPALLIEGAAPLRLPARVAATLARLGARAGLEGLQPAVWAALLLVLAMAGLGCGAVLVAGTDIAPLPILLASGLLPPACAHSWLRASAARRAAALVRELPAAIDLLVLCIESGASLGSALRIAHEKSPPGPLRDLFGGVLHQLRAGRARAEALRHALERWDLAPVTALLTAMIQAETRGMSLGPALRAQSGQCTADRFVRAERAAMQAPVKLLVPLLLCIFPCTFIVIAVPIAARFIAPGGP